MFLTPCCKDMSQRQGCTEQCKDANWKSREEYRNYREDRADGGTEEQKKSREEGERKAKEALLRLYNSVKDKSTPEAQSVSSFPPLFLSL